MFNDARGKVPMPFINKDSALSVSLLLEMSRVLILQVGLLNRFTREWMPSPPIEFPDRFTQSTLDTFSIMNFESDPFK